MQPSCLPLGEGGSAPSALTDEGNPVGLWPRREYRPCPAPPLLTFPTHGEGDRRSGG